MNTQLTLLPRRSPLLSGESLPSYVARLEALNHYPAGTLNWLCRRDVAREPGLAQDDVARPRQAATFAQLETLTGLTGAELFAASDHVLTQTLTPPEEPQPRLTLFDGSICMMVNRYTCQRRLHSANGAQFCPHCLREAAYHRLSWSPMASTLCLQHHYLLLSHCPACGHAVSVREIVRKECRLCQADLSAAPVVCLAHDAPGLTAQHWLQFWLGVAAKPLPFAAEGSTWPEVAPMALYRFMEGLRHCLVARQADWSHLCEPLAGLSELIPETIDHHQALSTTSSYYLDRVVFQAVQDWPHGFHRLLDAYRRPQRWGRMSTSLGACWGALFERWVQGAWLRPEFEFVQQAFRDYLWDGHLSLRFALQHPRFRNDERLARRWGLLNWEQTLRILNLPAGAVLRSAGSGSLRSATLPQAEMGERVFKRNPVLALARRWKAGVPLEEASRWLGLSAKDVEQLVHLGALALSRGDPRQRSSQWLLTQQSIVEFVAAVERHLKIAENISFLFRLQTALDYLRPIRIERTTLLKRLADGQLTGYKSRAWLGNLSKVYFQEQSLEALLKHFPAEQRWLTERDIVRRARVPLEVVVQWIGTQVISPIAQYGGSYYFDPDGMDEFCADCLTSTEAAQILTMDARTLIRKLVQPGWLHTLATPATHGCRGYVFHRSDVESLRSA